MYKFLMTLFYTCQEPWSVEGLQVDIDDDDGLNQLKPNEWSEHNIMI